MLRPAVPDPELLAWLWTEEGLDWHAGHMRRVAHARGVLAEVKNDHECSPLGHCEPNTYSPFCDEAIVHEIQVHGISGVPEEWKQHWRRCKEA